MLHAKCRRSCLLFRLSEGENEVPCPTGAGAYTETGPQVRPGQTLCYRLRMDFPADISTGGVQVNDFIPPGTTYVAGSTLTTPNNNVTITTGTPPQPDVNGSNLTWKLDDGADAVGKAQPQAGSSFTYEILGWGLSCPGSSQR